MHFCCYSLFALLNFAGIPAVGVLLLLLLLTFLLLLVSLLLLASLLLFSSHVILVYPSPSVIAVSEVP
jgi:hypothetical protein